jgi:hypothetical protein
MRMSARCARLLAVAQAVMFAATALAQPAGPLPLDPLTPAERELATRLAESDPRVKELLGSRSRRVYTEFIAVKRGEGPTTGVARPAEAPPAGRFADVLFIRYDTNVGVRVLVDLEAQRVIEVARVSGKSVPINSDEVQEAARLALADARVVRLLGDQANTFRVATGPATVRETAENRIEGLRTLGTVGGDPCSDHRCIVLFFRQANHYIRLNQVVVDLTTQRVIVQGGR